METTSYTNARNNLKALMVKTCADHTPMIITNQSTKSDVVMMSLEDYNAMNETCYLMQSPENAKRLIKSIEDTKENCYQKQNLLEE